MIDWARIQDLHNEIGTRAFSDVVELFLAETGNAITRLERCKGNGQLKAELHFLKGGVLNLGFTEVAYLCQQGERMTAEGEQTQTQVASIVQAYHNTRAVFTSEIETRLLGSRLSG